MPTAYFLELASGKVPCETLTDALEHPESSVGARIVDARGKLTATKQWCVFRGGQGEVAWVMES